MNARQLFLVKQESEKIIAQLSRNEKVRAVTPIAKYLLLNAPYWYDGHYINPVAKSLGAGVWELHKDEKGSTP